MGRGLTQGGLGGTSRSVSDSPETERQVGLRQAAQLEVCGFLGSSSLLLPEYPRWELLCVALCFLL